MTRDVVVIGAGVSGLSTACELMRRGRDVVVLERQVVIGGNAISERIDGFLMEHGPSTINAAVPTALEVVQELDLAASSVDLGAGVRKRYLLDAGKLSGISVHPLGFFTSSYLSLPARLSLLGEIMRPRRQSGGGETVDDFTRRRFGGEFARKVMEPLTAGLFMGDSRALSVDAAFPRLVEFERKFGSVTRAALNAGRGRQPGRRLFSWPGGIATLPRRLALTLGARIHTGTTVKRITPLASGFEVATASEGTIRTRAVVLAVQPHVAAALLEPVDPETSEAAGHIAAPPIGVVYLGYRRAQVSHPLDGLGFLATRDRSRAISGAQFCSTMFAGRAPAGHVSIACYVGGARNPALGRLPAGDMAHLVHEELSDVLGIRGTPVLTRVRHWARGLPQYNLGHPERRKVLESAHDRLPGLILTGNYLHGVSVANCLASARAAAEKAHRLLQARNRANATRVEPDHARA
ncbi:MAG: protoporphyrinogen oxidase [Alphaproteobacteria bacterium]